MGSHSPPCSTVERSITFLQVSFLISQVILQSPVFLIPINFVAVTAQWVPLTPSFQIPPIWLNFNLLLRCASIPLCLLYEVKTAFADKIFSVCVATSLWAQAGLQPYPYWGHYPNAATCYTVFPIRNAFLISQHMLNSSFSVHTCFNHKPCPEFLSHKWQLKQKETRCPREHKEGLLWFTPHPSTMDSFHRVLFMLFHYMSKATF